MQAPREARRAQRGCREAPSAFSPCEALCSAQTGQENARTTARLPERNLSPRERRKGQDGELPHHSHRTGDTSAVGGQGGSVERDGRGARTDGVEESKPRKQPQSQCTTPAAQRRPLVTLLRLSPHPSWAKHPALLLCKGCCYITGSELASPTPHIILGEELPDNYLGTVRSRAVS